MDLLSREELWLLVEEAPGTCVSIYLPTHRAGPDIQQDPIRLKNLLRTAEEKLTSGGLRSSDSRALLEPARRLLDDQAFWLHQADGLAIFISSGSFRYLRLPVSFRELVVVSEGFHIKPLLSLLAGDGRYYVLAVSQRKVRLIRCTRHTAEELELGGLSAGLDEALGYDVPERRTQMHTGREGRHGRQAGMFHGHGGEGIDDVKDNIRRYFKKADRGLRELFPPDGAPWVLAAVDYLLPIYQEASDNPFLLTEGVEGNPDRAGVSELQAAAWRLVEPEFRKRQTDALARFRERVGTGLASVKLDEVVPAAHHGRVDSLFVAIGVQRWGTYDASSNTVVEHASPEPGDRDLLDVAALRTLMNGGTVFAVEPERVPAEEDRVAAAALFRY